MGHTTERDTGLLDDFVRRHGAPCPADADRFEWSASALDDLARLVDAVAPAAEQVSGEPCDRIERRVQDLVTAIVAHRNSLMGASQGMSTVHTPVSVVT